MSNVLELHGNEKTMNLDPVLLSNIQSSLYFKNLFSKRTYHEVLDEINKNVDNLSPYISNTKNPSTAFCLLYKLFLMKTTVKQMEGLLSNDSPYARGIGVLYLRYCHPPAKIWDWYIDFIEDDETVVIAKNTEVTIQKLMLDLLKDNKFSGTILPRIPTKIQQDIDKKVQEYLNSSNNSSKYNSNNNNNNNNSSKYNSKDHSDRYNSSGSGSYKDSGDSYRDELERFKSSRRDDKYDGARYDKYDRYDRRDRDDRYGSRNDRYDDRRDRDRDDRYGSRNDRYDRYDRRDRDDRKDRDDDRYYDKGGRNDRYERYDRRDDGDGDRYNRKRSRSRSNSRDRESISTSTTSTTSKTSQTNDIKPKEESENLKKLRLLYGADSDRVDL